MHRTRELRCLFMELSEKLIEPWRQNQWQMETVKLFLPAITQSVLDLEVARYVESHLKFENNKIDFGFSIATENKRYVAYGIVICKSSAVV